MSKVLIAGCGYVGQALAALLLRDGHAVWGLRRDPPVLPAGLRPVAADLCDAPSLAGLPPGLDVVYYTAGADGFGETAYRRAYVEGLGNLIGALENQGQRPERMIFTSSTGVYHQNDGTLLDEDSPTQPTRSSGRILLEGEALLAAAPWTGITVRLGGIYGPGRTRLVEDLRAGRARKGPGYLNLIHRDDAAGILRHLLDLPAPAPCYLGVDGAPVARNDLLDWLAERLGVPAASDAVAAPPRRGGLRRFNNARIKAAGYRFRYPSYREGYSSDGVRS